MKKPKRNRVGHPGVHPLMLKEQRGIKLPRWLNNWLSNQPESAAELVEKALIKAHKLTPPEVKS